MMLTFSVTITEGILYYAIEGAVKSILPLLAEQIAGQNERTGGLATASGYTILRNNKPITAAKIREIMDKHVGSKKYGAVVTVGGVTVKIGL